MQPQPRNPQRMNGATLIICTERVMTHSDQVLRARDLRGASPVLRRPRNSVGDVATTADPAMAPRSRSRSRSRVTGSPAVALDQRNVQERAGASYDRGS